ncbi:hypothetical protein ACTG16_22790 [Aeromonas sp. 23P]|uniref:hypothetical protein n=1 Tax=Aeromonas sp. 23P TaxID=3452716 RepID=UPI003F7ADEF1|nr:hypothetical protein [Aeromonas veronii]
MKKNKPRITGYVKIADERGYGSGLYPVIGTCERDTCYVLQDPSGKTFSIYKAHCYRDPEAVRATIANSQKFKGEAKSFLDKHPLRRK